jgi:MinD-like ATPase involved in chromosome partitioning or flagellar assembly
MLLEKSHIDSPRVTKTLHGQSFLVGVWGSAGSGKSLVAINLAFELTRLSNRVLLIDSDFRRPSVSSWLGLTNSGPGISAALRLARTNRLAIDDLLRFCAELKFGGSRLEILPGLTNPARSREVVEEDLETLLSVTAGHFDFVILDLNDELPLDVGSEQESTSVPRLTKWLVEHSDLVLATLIADPVGLNRFLFDATRVGRDFWSVANRVNSRTYGKNVSIDLRRTVEMITEMPLKAELPNDAAGCDATILKARPLLLECPNSKLTLAVRSLANEIHDEFSSRLNSRNGKS